MIEKFAAKTELKKSAVEVAVDSVPAMIAETLQANERVDLRGFPARKSRLAAAGAWKEKAAAWQANMAPLVTLLTVAGHRFPPPSEADE